MMDIHLVDSTCLSLYLSQCRQVKITILGDECVPVQVDGEAWLQPPGFIRIVHKNRTQTLTRDRVSTYPHPPPHPSLTPQPPSTPVFVLIRAPLVSRHKEKRGLVPLDVLI